MHTMKRRHTARANCAILISLNLLKKTIVHMNIKVEATLVIIQQVLIKMLDENVIVKMPKS